MPKEPTVKRTVAFFDGQNLFHAAREAFGYTYPNYDPVCLVNAICKLKNWQLNQVRFYTGIPDLSDDPFWNQFWAAKLRFLSWQGVHVFSRTLRYRNQRVKLPDGTEHTFLAGEEQGIDVRIALDVIRLAHRNEYECRSDLQSGPRPLGSGGGSPGDRKRAKPLDQSGLCLPFPPHKSQPSGH